MDQQQWDAMDAYLCQQTQAHDEVLEAALAASNASGLPPINVAPNQGKLLNLLARLRGARHILEIGTLGGYSTIWLARALPPDGTLLSLGGQSRLRRGGAQESRTRGTCFGCNSRGRRGGRIA